jgi:hypothetical protein
MDCKLATFEIKFLYCGKIYKAKVEQTFLSDIHERFTVIGGKKSIEITSNRPLIKKTGGRKKIKMQAVNINIAYQELAQTIINQIQEHIYKLEHPPFNWSEHPKNK